MEMPSGVNVLSAINLTSTYFKDTTNMLREETNLFIAQGMLGMFAKIWLVGR